MDRLVYVAMEGAKESLRAQTANNHNLANASTTGFRADLSAFQTRDVAGAGLPSRAYATDSSVGWDSAAGELSATGRDLDTVLAAECAILPSHAGLMGEALGIHNNRSSNSRANASDLSASCCWCS